MGDEQEDESVTCVTAFLLEGVASGKVSGRALYSGEWANICPSWVIHLLKHLFELGLGLGACYWLLIKFSMNSPGVKFEVLNSEFLPHALCLVTKHEAGEKHVSHTSFKWWHDPEVSLGQQGASKVGFRFQFHEHDDAIP